MAHLFEQGPRLFSPAWRFSLGFSLGFYPLSLPLRLRVGLALAACLVAAVLAFRGAITECGEERGGEKPDDGRAEIRRIGTVLLAVFFGGMAVGAGYSALGFGVSTKIGGPADLWRFAARSQSAGHFASTEPRLASLRLAGIAGNLSADSRPARAGQRLMDLAVDRVFVVAPGMTGSYATKARLRAIVRDGPSLASGARIELRGRLAADGSPLIFADRRDLLLRDEGSSLARLRNRLHEALLTSILAALGRGSGRGEGPTEESTRGDDAAGLLLALLAGWQDELSPEDAAAFKAAGCTHILALSGQHLALIAAGLIFILRPMLGPLRALPPTFGLVWLYVVVVGPGPSLLRALISFAIVAIASLSDRPQDGRAILGLCFAVHALIFPDQLREAGFVLSYLAVGGLVILAPRIDYLLAPYVPPPLATALAASLAAQIATSPWIALSFGIMQPVGIVATLATATLVEAVMIGGLLAALLVAILPAAALLTAPVELFLLRLLEEAMRLFAALPSVKLDEPLTRAIGAAAIVLLAAFLYAVPHVRFPGRSGQAAGPLGGSSRI